MKLNMLTDEVMTRVAEIRKSFDEQTTFVRNKIQESMEGPFPLMRANEDFNVLTQYDYANDTVLVSIWSETMDRKFIESTIDPNKYGEWYLSMLESRPWEARQ